MLSYAFWAILKGAAIRLVSFRLFPVKHYHMWGYEMVNSEFLHPPSEVFHLAPNSENPPPLKGGGFRRGQGHGLVMPAMATRPPPPCSLAPPSSVAVYTNAAPAPVCALTQPARLVRPGPAAPRRPRAHQQPPGPPSPCRHSPPPHKRYPPSLTVDTMRLTAPKLKALMQGQGGEGGGKVSRWAV